MDIDLNKYIEFRPKRDGRVRPFIKDTRVEVSYIVVDSECHGLDAAEIAIGYPHLSLAAIHAALAFYHGHRDEFRRMMREDEEVVRQLQDANGAVTVPIKRDGISPVAT